MYIKEGNKIHRLLPSWYSYVGGNTNKERGVDDCDALCFCCSKLCTKQREQRKGIEESKQMQKVHGREDILGVLI